MTRFQVITALAACLMALTGAPAAAAGPPQSTPATSGAAATTVVPALTRNGRDIYARFREGLAEPACDDAANERWQRHFANAPRKLAAPEGDVLPLFGYVVDALREADLPTEYALIPFVESGYRPGAQSAGGPAGLWQFIALTARNHHVRMRPGYDGRLSPIESTRAAVRYLKTLHGMFAGDWRLAVMAYNAGEYRVFGALKRSGQIASKARPEELEGLAAITQAYVRKLHALSCVLDRADDRSEWREAMDRPVAVLAPVELPPSTGNLGAWASRRGVDAGLVQRINPAFANGKVPHGGPMPRVLAPVSSNERLASGATPPPSTLADRPPAAPAAVTTMADATFATIIEAPQAPLDTSMPVPRTHVVAGGDSVWRIAKRYGISRSALLERNDLTPNSVLRPGMTLRIDAATL